MREIRYAILIGNSHYPVDEQFDDLRTADQDVDGLADVLSDPNVGPFDEVVRLKSAAHHDILDAIFHTLGLARKDDLVLIYFSGHGQCDEQGRLHIAALNSQSDLMGVTAVPLDALKDAIDNCHTTRIVLIFDCLFRDADGGLLDVDRLDASMRQFSSGRGKYILMSPGTLSFLQEKQNGTVSLLTKHLIQGLRTGHADIDGAGVTRIEDLYQFACAQLTTEHQQEPLKWDLSRKGDLVLVQRETPPQAAVPGGIATAPRVTPEAIKARYDAIVQLFKKGEVIPFLGPALVHRSGARPPIHDELAQQLADSVGLSTDMEPLTLISQKIDMVVGRGVVYNNLRTLYQPEPYTYRPDLAHRFLACVEAPLLLVSTAYDTLLEAAFDDAGKPYATVTHLLHADQEADRGKVVVEYSDRKGEVEKCLSEELVIDLKQWSVIYKIQGTFGLYDPDSDEEIDSIVISEEDYISLVTLLDNPQTSVPNQLARQFKKRMFLFLGYSLSDWNFRAIVDVIQRKGNFRRTQPYAVCKQVSEFENLYWENKRVRLIEADTAEFISDISGMMGFQL